ncbi:MAG: hypothetical protein ACMZ66_05435 [Thalassospira sp.]|uniref:hypothetical protein n=1 Tax=Thalassospira sp. TaxID=1912094 RepID=UPI003A856BB8
MAEQATKTEQRFRPVQLDEDQATDTVIIKISGTRTKQGATRRKQDRRLFDAMERSPLPCERAFDRIARGYLVITGQVRVKVARLGEDLDLMAGKSDEELFQEYISGLKRDYLEWADRVMGAVDHPDRFIRHAAAIEIIGECHSASYVDETRRKRKGWALNNLVEVLEEFCRLKRWG